MKSKIQTGLAALLGLMMINSGLNKFFNYMPAPEGMSEGAQKLMMAFIESGYMFPLIALVEIVGGFFFILPKTRLLGALLLMPIVVNILFFHMFLAIETLPVALVILGILLWVIVERKDKWQSILS